MKSEQLSMRIFVTLILCSFLFGCGNSKERAPTKTGDQPENHSPEKEQRISDFKRKTLLELVREQKDPLRKQLEEKIKKALKVFNLDSPDDVSFTHINTFIDHRAQGWIESSYRREIYFMSQELNHRSRERINDKLFNFFLKYAQENQINLSNFTKQQKEDFTSKAFKKFGLKDPRNNSTTTQTKKKPTPKPKQKLISRKAEQSETSKKILSQLAKERAEIKTKLEQKKLLKQKKAKINTKDNSLTEPNSEDLKHSTEIQKIEPKIKEPQMQFTKKFILKNGTKIKAKIFMKADDKYHIKDIDNKQHTIKTSDITTIEDPK